MIALNCIRQVCITRGGGVGQSAKVSKVGDIVYGVVEIQGGRDIEALRRVVDKEKLRSSSWKVTSMEVI